MTVTLQKLKWRSRGSPTELPQWEEDYLLNPVDHYYLMEEYMEMSMAIYRTTSMFNWLFFQLSNMDLYFSLCLPFH